MLRYSGTLFYPDLTIAGAANVCSTIVVHDLSVQNPTGFVTIGGAGCGNQVGHDLTVQGASGNVTVSNNTVAHDLRVQNNHQATVSQNSAGHDAVCQGNGTQTGGGNTAAHSNGCPA